MKKENKENLILEKVYIETPVDTDGDGLRDLITVWIARPETEEKVPAVMVADPYLMTCNEELYVLHDVDRELGSYPEQNHEEPDVVGSSGVKSFGEYIDKFIGERYSSAKGREANGIADPAALRIDSFPEFEAISGLYDHLNGRGYATVFAGGLGTRGSDGMTLTGSPEEIAAFRAVIDWLCGRAKAFSDKTSGLEVEADWCTGKVAMSGKSYLGTLCWAVAATGVDGLEAIIPEAGISNWYEYYRFNGLCVSPFDWQGDDIDLLSLYCMSRAKDPEDWKKVEGSYKTALSEVRRLADRDSGNYNDFWDVRNYRRNACGIKAASLIIHGLNDWNVKADQGTCMFRELESLGKDRKMILHQGEHIHIYDLKGSGCLKAVDEWLDHFLKGEKNGTLSTPKVMVQSNTDQSNWHVSETWPPESVHFEIFKTDMLGSGSDAERYVSINDDISLTAYDREKDDRKAWRDQLVLEEDLPHRIRLVSEPYEEDCRIAGKIQVRFSAAVSRSEAILSVMAVDLGEDRRLTLEQKLTGENDADPEEFVFGTEEEPTAYRIISRGWMDARNRTALWQKEETEPGRYYEYSISMMANDYTLRKGHRLAVILYGADCDFTLRPLTPTAITYDRDSIAVEIPFAEL